MRNMAPSICGRAASSFQLSWQRTRSLRTTMLVQDPPKARADLSERRKPSFRVELGARAEQDVQPTSRGTVCPRRTLPNSDVAADKALGRCAPSGPRSLTPVVMQTRAFTWQPVEDRTSRRSCCWALSSWSATLAMMDARQDGEPFRRRQTGELVPGCSRRTRTMVGGAGLLSGRRALETTRRQRRAGSNNGNSDARRRVAGRARMGYPVRMQLPVELTDAQLESLRDRAKSLGISPEQLASAAVADLVERPADDFTRAASKVLSKNAELYRRLAR
jgi:hypothetical protein